MSETVLIAGALLILLLWAGLLASGLRRRRDHRQWAPEDQRRRDVISRRCAFQPRLLKAIYGGAQRP